jgi:hypothetical protein
MNAGSTFMSTSALLLLTFLATGIWPFEACIRSPSSGGSASENCGQKRFGKRTRTPMNVGESAVLAIGDEYVHHANHCVFVKITLNSFLRNIYMRAKTCE